jgi:hypothetical protein
MRRARKQQEVDRKHSLPEDGGGVFLQNVVVHFQPTIQGYIPEYRALYIRSNDSILMNNQSKKMRKEAVVAYFTVLFRHFPERTEERAKIRQ